MKRIIILFMSMISILGLIGCSDDATFTCTDDGSIIYKYYIDNVFVTIQPTSSDDLLECYCQRKNIVISDNDVTICSTDNALKNGHMLRKNLIVIYCIM